MKNNLNKTWLVFGASSGIGKVTTLQLLNRGYNVIAVARRILDYNHDNLLALSTDITKPETINQTIQKGLERFGTIDFLLNSAGISSYGTFEEENIDVMREVMEVNFWGSYNSIKAILPYFRENKKGVIINISSEMGLYPRAYGAAYCSSKYALEGLTNVLRWETKDFCKVISVELDKFNGTEIGANKPKGVSNIKEYQNLKWLETKDINFEVDDNDLKIAVEYIIDEALKDNPSRHLLLGKTICHRANQELNLIKKDIKNSLIKSYKCAHFDIAKLCKKYFKYKFLSIFSLNKKKDYYKKKVEFIENIKKILK
ncbi:MAG: SDR family NAD(P)-dependent oxidoreductase [Candidatus Gastranaerophilales bacterium]|nr:SDR family NAD(P)-dependent oxidoreductase [Candidatus Gastranaerophilales bacterium]